MSQKIKLTLLAGSTHLADKLVTLITHKVDAEVCYWRVHRIADAFYPTLRWIYTRVRPRAHHYTFRLQIYKLLLSRLQKKYHGYKIPLKTENEATLLHFLKNQKPSLIISPHLRLTTILGKYLGKVCTTPAAA